MSDIIAALRRGEAGPATQNRCADRIEELEAANADLRAERAFLLARSERQRAMKPLLRRRRDLIRKLSSLSDEEKAELADLDKQIEEYPTALTRRDHEASEIIRRAADLIKTRPDPAPQSAPGHTDLMVPPETLDAYLEANPPTAPQTEKIEASPFWRHRSKDAPQTEQPDDPDSTQWKCPNCGRYEYQPSTECEECGYDLLHPPAPQDEEQERSAYLRDWNDAFQRALDLGLARARADGRREGIEEAARWHEDQADRPRMVSAERAFHIWCARQVRTLADSETEN